MYDIIIVGAGPAGLTAALYARRNNKKVLVLEKRSYGGGIINTSKIDNYPSTPDITGFDFATNLYNQVKKLDVEIKYEEVNEIKNHDNLKEVITKNNSYETKTIILATGSINRKLGLENEEKLIGKGVSYCATCDGAFYKNKNVAVVGGGNTALEETLYLSNIASKVYLIHRRNEFRAEENMISMVKEKSNVEIIYNSNVTKLNGEDTLNSIEITNNDVSIKNVEVSGLFIAIGRIPENDIFKDLIELDNNGYIKADENCHTNIDGIYVCGDNRTKKLRQLVTATSDGAIASTEAIKYINNLK